MGLLGKRSRAIAAWLRDSLSSLSLAAVAVERAAINPGSLRALRVSGWLGRAGANDAERDASVREIAAAENRVS
jgi:hypothetical protein